MTYSRLSCLTLPILNQLVFVLLLPVPNTVLGFLAPAVPGTTVFLSSNFAYVVSASIFVNLIYLLNSHFLALLFSKLSEISPFLLTWCTPPEIKIIIIPIIVTLSSCSISPLCLSIKL